MPYNCVNFIFWDNVGYQEVYNSYIFLHNSSFLLCNHLCLCLGFLPLEKAMVTHSSTPAWRIPWTEESGRLQSMGSLRDGHDWATSLSLFTFIIGEGNGNPLQCSCLENPRDGGAWWAAVYGVSQSRTRLKWLSSSRLFASVSISTLYDFTLPIFANYNFPDIYFNYPFIVFLYCFVSDLALGYII